MLTAGAGASGLLLAAAAAVATAALAVVPAAAPARHRHWTKRPTALACHPVAAASACAWYVLIGAPPWSARRLVLLVCSAACRGDALQEDGLLPFAPSAARWSRQSPA